MRKVVVWLLIGIFIVLVLGESGILTSLLMFLLVGAIPGTGYAVPAGVMLLVMTISAWFVLLQFAAFKLFRSWSLRRLTEQHQITKKRMPRRRYSQI